MTNAHPPGLNVQNVISMEEYRRIHRLPKGGVRQGQTITRDEFRRLEPEKDFQARVIELAEANGWAWMHISTSVRIVSGGKVVGDKECKDFPDLVLWRAQLPTDDQQQLLFVELKREGEEPRPGQALVLSSLMAATARAFWWQPSDWPEIERVLARTPAA